MAMITAVNFNTENSTLVHQRHCSITPKLQTSKQELQEVNKKITGTFLLLDNLRI